MRANVFRFVPKNGHSSMQLACRFVADRRRRMLGFHFDARSSGVPNLKRLFRSRRAKLPRSYEFWRRSIGVDMHDVALPR